MAALQARALEATAAAGHITNILLADTNKDLVASNEGLPLQRLFSGASHFFLLSLKLACTASQLQASLERAEATGNLTVLVQRATELQGASV